MAVDEARTALLTRFRWEGGHADVWRVFADPHAFAAERGSQATAVRQLIQSCGATFLGLSVLVDQLDEVARPPLGRVTALVRYDELGDPETGPAASARTPAHH